MDRRNQGQIIPRGEKKWLVRVFLGRVDGKKKYSSKTVEGTYKQAEQSLTKMRREQDTDTFVLPTKQSVETYLLGTWLPAKVDGLAISTAQHYPVIIKRYILPTLGKLQLQQVSPLAIQALYTKLATEGKSKRTVQYVHSILRQAFQHAVGWGLLQANPASVERVIRPRESKQERRLKIKILTPDQTKTVLEKARELGPVWHALFAIQLTTGLRPQEVRALLWEDYRKMQDGSGVLDIRRAVKTLDKGKIVVQEMLKTMAGRRSVSLPSYTTGLLDTLKAGAKHQDGLIFRRRGNTVIGIGTVRRQWKILLESAKVPYVKLYAARHSHLTHLLIAGENPRVVSERAGHGAGAAFTLDTYTAVLEEMHQGAATRIQELLFSTPPAIPGPVLSLVKAV